MLPIKDILRIFAEGIFSSISNQLSHINTKILDNKSSIDELSRMTDNTLPFLNDSFNKLQDEFNLVKQGFTEVKIVEDRVNDLEDHLVGTDTTLVSINDQLSQIHNVFDEIRTRLDSIEQNTTINRADIESLFSAATDTGA
jgi:chromosome segregation ATPase